MKRHSSGTAFEACRAKFDSIEEHTVPLVRAVSARIERLAERVRNDTEVQENPAQNDAVDLWFDDTPLAMPAGPLVRLSACPPEDEGENALEDGETEKRTDGKTDQ